MTQQEARDAEDRLRRYYRRISAKGKEVMQQKRADGEVMHKAPLGYKNARDELGRSILIPDPETYPLVQEAKRLRAEGMSMRRLREVLSRRGLRGKYGSEISLSSLHRLLLSPDQSGQANPAISVIHPL